MFEPILGVGVVAVRRGGGDSVLGRAAAALPGVDSFAVLAGADPAVLSPSDLVDAVICSERLLAHVHFLQSQLLAELGRPGRCGDVGDLVAALVGKAGQGRGADGQVDPVVVAELTAQRSIGVAATEVAAVLDWSPVTARIRIDQAHRLQSALPGTLAALGAGRVDVGRVRMITERTAVLSPEMCRRVEPRILKLVKGRSKGRLETLVDREVILADPDAAEGRRIKALKDRCVGHRVDRDGMGVITALLSAEAAVMVFTLVDLIADANRGLDGRTVDQRRADAIADIADELLTFGFVDLHGLIAKADHATADTADTTGTATATDAADTADFASDVDGAVGGREAAADDAVPDEAVPDDAAPAEDAAPDDAVPDDAVPGSAAPTEDAAPAGAGAAGRSSPATSPISEVSDADRGRRLSRAMSRHGRRPHLNVTGAWSTLAGLDDLPGHLDGHGVITAQLLRAIAASWGSLTAVGVNPDTGTATAVGATTYRPSQLLCDQVIVLSGTCRMPGCAMPAWKCDIDHLVPFDHDDPARGGLSSLCNTVTFCKWHHLLKHHTDWTPQLQADLSIRWTTNTGHQVVSHPRQFTLPGEWDRPPPDTSGDRSAQNAAPAGSPEAQPGRKPALVTGPADITEPATTEPATTDPTLTSALTNSNPAVIVGPTVTGPTIPVVPAGTEWAEPNTELQDPDSIPHPGSVEINSYRILRRSAREHSLRRLSGLGQRQDPAEQRTRDFINGRAFDTDGNPLNPEEFDQNTRAEARITQNILIAQLVERSRRPKVTEHKEAEHRDAVAELDERHQWLPISDEPPF